MLVSSFVCLKRFSIRENAAGAYWGERAARSPALLMENSQAGRRDVFALIYEPFAFVYKRVSAAIRQTTPFARH